jgi:hypothetical protein
MINNEITSTQRACVAYVWLLFKYAFICIPNTGRHIRIVNNVYNYHCTVKPILGGHLWHKEKVVL